MELGHRDLSKRSGLERRILGDSPVALSSVVLKPHRANPSEAPILGPQEVHGQAPTPPWGRCSFFLVLHQPWFHSPWSCAVVIED